jgi:hypothetical protein
MGAQPFRHLIEELYGRPTPSLGGPAACFVEAQNLFRVGERDPSDPGHGRQLIATRHDLALLDLCNERTVHANILGKLFLGLAG